MLTDEQIAGLTPTERRELIRRIARPEPGSLPSPGTVRRLRKVRLLVTVGGAVLLVPWTIYLAATLPGRALVDDWPTVWVGFDVALLLMLVGTGWLGWQRRQAMIPTAFATGTLILADAWFDVATAGPTGLPVSVAMAVVVEGPVAALLISSSLRLLRLNAMVAMGLPASVRWWRVPISGGLVPVDRPREKDTLGTGP